jgi:hypothetical protein
MSLFPLRGIPPAAFDYRLGNRSALNWVPNQEPDQYRVSTDPRSGITNDPTPEGEGHDERYMLRHIGLVITVSLETQRSSPSSPPSTSPPERWSRRMPENACGLSRLPLRPLRSIFPIIYRFFPQKPQRNRMSSPQTSRNPASQHITRYGGEGDYAPTPPENKGSWPEYHRSSSRSPMVASSKGLQCAVARTCRCPCRYF